jgi:hypothetical protein
MLYNEALYSGQTNHDWCNMIHRNPSETRTTTWVTMRLEETVGQAPGTVTRPVAPISSGSLYGGLAPPSSLLLKDEVPLALHLS